MLNLSHTMPPEGLVMPETAQFVTAIIFDGGAALILLYAIYLAYRYKSLLPLLFVSGGVLCVVLEPCGNLLGNVMHPQVGQNNAFISNGVPVPWHIVFAYAWYMGAGPILLYRQMMERSITPSFLWRVFLGGLLAVGLVEQIPLYYKVWVYYGYQPHKIGLMPAWWIFADTACTMVPLILVYNLFPILKGWRQLLVLGLMPAGVLGGHAAAGFPMYVALGTDTATFPHIIIQLASFCTMVLSVLVVWTMIHISFSTVTRP